MLPTSSPLLIRQTKLWVALLLVLSGCATAPPLPDTLLGDIASRQLLSVPFIPQEKYYCGPAALASMARFRGIDVDQQTLAEQVYIPDRQGSLALEMQAGARRLGLLAYPLAKANLTDLLRELDAGNPVLVLQNQGLSWLPQWHYAVAVGYDLGRRELILHSGTRQNYHLALATFFRTWQRGGGWARVLVTADTLPATAAPIPLVQSANDLALSGHPALAGQFYRRALARWPSSPAVLTAAANQALAEQRNAEAMALYQQLLAIRPSAAVWNNYAYALLAEGCDQQARTAIARAVALQPGQFADSREEIAAKAGAPQQHLANHQSRRDALHEVSDPVEMVAGEV